MTAVTLPAPPAELEVRWRAPTRADVPAWRRLMAAVEVADDPSERYTADDLGDEFADPHARPDSDALFGFDDDGLVAFGWVQTRPGAQRSHRIVLWGDVHPRLRRRGAGTFLMRWLEARGRQIAASYDDGLPVWLEASTEDGHPGRVALFAASGYTPLRHWFEMRRDLAQPVADVPPPAGLELCAWDPDRDEAVRAAHNEAFADHWGSEPRSADDWRLWVTGHRNFRPDLSLLALDGDEVAGYLLAAYYPQDAEASGLREAWVNTVGVRRPWRRRGCAAALLTANMRAATAAGLQYAALGVDTANPSGALGVYERLGFETVKRTTSYAKQL